MQRRPVLLTSGGVVPHNRGYGIHGGRFVLMRKADAWTPTKYVQSHGRWRGSRNPAHVSPASRLVSDRAVAGYVDAINRHARGDLLDVGCGHAPLYGVYRDRVDSVNCIDWGDSPYLDHEHDLNQTPWPVQPGFDTIVATDVLEHLAHPDRFFAEVRRLLRPGGVLILGVPFMYWIHAGPHDHHRYTEYRLRLFCEEHGLDVESCDPYGGAFDILADVFGKLADGSSLTRWAARLAQMSPPRRSERRGERVMPLGYVLVAWAR